MAVPNPGASSAGALSPISDTPIGTAIAGIPVIPWASITDIDVQSRNGATYPALLTLFIKGSYQFKSLSGSFPGTTKVANGMTEVQIGFEKQQDARTAQNLLLKVLADVGAPTPTVH